MTDPARKALAALLPADPKGRRLGRIVSHHGKVVNIETAEGQVEWKRPHREDWVVGDIVIFEKDRPKLLHTRLNEFARKNPTGKRAVLAANLDWLAIVTSCGPLFKLGLVDRFITAAAHAGITPVIVLNKIDLPDGPECMAGMEEYSAAGYAVHCVSANTGEGVDRLAASLADGVSSMVGQSGVGKTSILNRISPEVERATREISKYSGKGRHTTTMSLMTALPNGGAIIDSPGIRQFAPAGLAPETVAHHFPVIDTLAGECKFRDCLHQTEPGCAIKQAIGDGRLSEDRYQSYLKILNDIIEDKDQSWFRRPEK